MNILHIVDEPYDSGIVHYALEAAAGLKERGHSVHFAGKEKRFPVLEAERKGINTLALPVFPASVASLRRYIQAQKIELINVHTGSSQTLGVLSTRGIAPEIPIIRTRGDARPVRRTATSSLLWQRTAGFIAATQKILTEFKAANPHLQIPMIAVLPGLRDPEAAPLTRNKNKTVGMVARLDPVKGHIHLLRAAQKVLKQEPGTRFLIAGRDENIKAAHLKDIASDLEISSSVEFKGHVPDQFEFMRRCDVGVIASTGSEAVSRVAIEWMALGRPVVSTSVGCLPEIVLDGETGFLTPPEDADAMAERILRLIREPELSESFSRRGRRRYEEQFSEARFIDQTERFYEETLHHLSPR